MLVAVVFCSIPIALDNPAGLTYVLAYVWVSPSHVDAGIYDDQTSQGWVGKGQCGIDFFLFLFLFCSFI